MPGTFDLLDHTSEVGFRATGVTLAGAFTQAGRAVFQVMTDIDALTTDETVDIDVESEGLEAALYDFVDELIYIAEVEGVLLREFDLTVERGETVTVRGTGRGQRIGGQDRLQDVKAPTYGDIIAEKTGDGWVLQLTLDV